MLYFELLAYIQIQQTILLRVLYEQYVIKRASAESEFSSTAVRENTQSHLYTYIEGRRKTVLSPVNHVNDEYHGDRNG